MQDKRIEIATVQGLPKNLAQPASMHVYCGKYLEHRTKPVCRTPAKPDFSATPEVVKKERLE